MEIIRNLSNVQKGLLAGLAIGIVAVYICLCLSAVGIIPLSLPGVKLGGAVAQATTDAAAPPTPTSMSNIPTEESTPITETEPTEEPTPATTEGLMEQATSTATAMALLLESAQTEGVIAAAPGLEVEETASTPVAPSANEAGARVSVKTPEPPIQPLGATAGEMTSEKAMTSTGTGMASEGASEESAPAPAVVLVLPTAAAPAAPSAAGPAVKMASVIAAQSVAPGPTPQWIWQGIEIERIPGKPGSPAAVLAVRVLGIPNREVYVREVTSGLSTTLLTGRKPQYGDFSDDVAGLPPATYVIEPKDIDAKLQVALGQGDFVLVEFALRPPPGWDAESVSGVTPVAVTQGTPVVQGREAIPSPTVPSAQIIVTAQPPATRMLATPVQPTPMATTAQIGIMPTQEPEWTWQGIVYEHRKNTGNPVGVIAVRVVDVPDRKVFIKERSGTWETTLVTGRKPDYGRFSDDVGGLGPGTFIVKPMDIDSEVEVTLERGDFVLVEFALRPAPGWTPQPTQAALAPVVQPTPLVQQAQPLVQPAAPPQAVTLAAPTQEPEWTWQGIVYEHRKNTGNPVGVIAVRVVDVPDRKVFIKERSGTWETTLVTGRKPDYGRFSDDVGGLGPGTFIVKPMDIDSEVEVTLERGDFVLVEFALRPAPGWTPQPTQAALAPVVQPTPLVQQAQPLVQPAAPPQAVTLAAPAQGPEWTWQGIVYEHRKNTGDTVGIIAVRVVDVPDRKVFVKEKSGTWEATLLTGRKPDYGKFSDDVGGLGPGTFVVKPMDIDSEVEVTLERGDFVLVEFALRPAPGWTPDQSGAVAAAPLVGATPGQGSVMIGAASAGGAPTPTLVPGWTWEGREVERKPGVQTGNALSRLVIRGIALPNWQVTVRQAMGGAPVSLRLERHAEYGNFAGVLEGLTPATYVVELADGVGTPAQVTLGQGDFVLLEFFPKPASSQ